MEFIPCDFGWLGVWGLNPQVVVTLFMLAKSPEIVCVCVCVCVCERERERERERARENLQGVTV